HTRSKRDWSSDVCSSDLPRPPGPAAVVSIAIRLSSEGLPMTRTYNVIDADGHILEPLDLWDKYMDPEFRQRRPRFVIDENGKEQIGRASGRERVYGAGVG